MLDVVWKSEGKRSSPVASQVPKPLLPSPCTAHTLGTHSTVTVHQIQKVCVCGGGEGEGCYKTPEGCVSD